LSQNALKRISIILFGISLFLLLGVTASGFYLLSKWATPLGPALNLPTYTASSIAAASISTIQAPTSTNSGSPATQLTATTQPLLPVDTPTPTRQPLCGGPTSITILMIGSDARSTGYLYGLADSIHVARIDFTVPNVMVVDFPRDLWVEIPGIAEHHGITHGKLNQAYLYGNPGMGYYDGPGEGPGLLARTLDLNYGMRVDHYIAVDLQTFAKMIDAVGGLDINLKSSVDLNYGNHTPDPALILPAGMNHLNGELATELARNRIPTTFQRMKYQKIIMSALREKLLRPEMLPRLPLLAAQFIGSVQTDLSIGDINSLICIAKQIPAENILADSFPQDMFKADVTYDENRNVTTFVYDVDNAKLREMVAEFMNGIWPMP
jgi:LCP family protein required for cell wall assembly